MILGLPSRGGVKNLNSKTQVIIKHVPEGMPIVALHIPESLGSVSRGQLTVRDRGNGLKTQPVVYRWTSGAGWVKPRCLPLDERSVYCWTNEAGWVKSTSYEAVRMKAVNHKPMTRPKGTLALQGGKEVRKRTTSPAPSRGGVNA
jgi:putative transposase